MCIHICTSQQLIKKISCAYESEPGDVYGRLEAGKGMEQCCDYIINFQKK